MLDGEMHHAFATSVAGTHMCETLGLWHTSTWEQDTYRISRVLKFFWSVKSANQQYQKFR